MPLHPQLQRMLDRAAALPAFETLTPAEVRAGDLARYARVPLPPVASVEDRWIDGPRGPLRVRVYRPDGEDGRPVTVFLHGSGFVICSVETHDGLCRQLCLAARTVVVSIDYALAPEQPFPAAPDDALAATRWVMAEAAGFGGDPRRVALAGDSAGGTLAVVTALRLREAGENAPLSALLLMYPVADHPGETPPPSYAERGEGFGLGAATMRWFWGHYLSRPEDAAHPHASPLRAPDLSGLPPAYVMVAEYDPLRDEGLALARRLEEAGSETAVRLYGDMAHGFMSWVGVLDRADEALADAAAWLLVRAPAAPLAPAPPETA